MDFGEISNVRFEEDQEEKLEVDSTALDNSWQWSFDRRRGHVTFTL